MAQHSHLTVDRTPHDVSRLPFANENGLQKFVQTHARAILDLEVIANTLRDGRPLFKIDTLAIDKSDRPFIIEYKWDLVDEEAFGQLAKYRQALLSGWSRFEERLSQLRGSSVRLTKTEPVLVAIGHRYDRFAFCDDQPAVCLAYKYHDVVFTDERLQGRRPGRVSLHHAAEEDVDVRRHPRVNKISATHKHLALLDGSLQRAFWALDAKLVKLDGVVPTYGGKNVVRYETRNGVFAKALINPRDRRGLIQWHFKSPKALRSSRTFVRRATSGNLSCLAEMCAAPDEAKIFGVLREVHRDAG